MQVLADDGARLDVRVDGDGSSAVALIHGFPLTREIWDAQAAALSRAHRVVRPDLRGAGASQQTDGPYLMETLAADLATTLDALGIARVALVGHSLGGYVALAFARMYSERLTHLALVCSRLAADAPERAAARYELADAVEARASAEPAVDAYLPNLFAADAARERPDLVARARAIAMANGATGTAATLRGMALRDDAGDIAPDLDVPVLVLAGGRDLVVPRTEAEENARAFRRGRLVVCEASGHLPMLEEPGCVTEALEALLRRGVSE